jgi:4-amino-4-deoxy-L-arabinose transferase-like glycosyltransferase
MPVLIGCLLYVAMALFGVSHDSGTFDEYAHVTAGYSYWAFNDYRLNPEYGNLAQRIVALPLVLRSDTDSLFPRRDQRAWHLSEVWALSDQFFFGKGHDADALLFSARVPVAIIGALLGALVFFWARRLFGDAGAYVSFILYIFSPTMLANGAVATSDMIGAAFFVASLFAVWAVLHRVTPGALIASLLAVGGLFLAKPSAPLFLPIVLAMIAVQLIGRRPIAWRIGRAKDLSSRTSRTWAVLLVTAAHAVVAYVLIWSAYGFRYASFAPGTPATDSFIDPWSNILEKPGLTTSLATWGRAHHILPESYLYGFATVIAYSRERLAFLNGVVTIGGSHAFFPYTTLVKTTIPGLLLVLGAMAVVVMAWRQRRTAAPAAAWLPDFYEWTPLLLGIGVYGASAVSSSLNIGHRHLLPLIPLVMVLVGVVGSVVASPLRQAWPFRPAKFPRDRSGLAAAAVAALLLWHAGESLAIAPHYLAYFNELVGGPSQGYRHLVDSSLDWGQDLPSLKDWLDREGLQGPNHPPVYLSYFGTAIPGYWGIDATLLASFEDRWVPHRPAPLTPGVYCFSATMLQGVYFMTPGAWNEKYETDYQSMIYNVKLFDSTAANPTALQALLKQTGEQFWVKNFQLYEHLRAARLAAFLRRREPDAQVGYSILIYRVNDDELARALNGPPPP